MRNVVAINEPPPFLRRYDHTTVFHFNRQDSKDAELKWDKLSVFDASVLWERQHFAKWAQHGETSSNCTKKRKDYKVRRGTSTWGQKDEWRDKQKRERKILKHSFILWALLFMIVLERSKLTQNIIYFTILLYSEVKIGTFKEPDVQLCNSWTWLHDLFKWTV